MKGLFMIVLLASSCASLDYYKPSGTMAQSEHKWNAFEQRWEVALPDAKIKWNAFEQEWEY